MKKNASKTEIEYRQEVFAQKTPYLQWLKKQEAELCGRYAEPSKGYGNGKKALGEQLYTLPFSSCMDSMRDYEVKNDGGIYLFVKEKGRLTEYAVPVILESFSEHRDAVLVYADEDYRGGLQELYGIDAEFFDGGFYRGAPWFKPDFSPDTLASFFYLGSIFAVRGDAVLAAIQKYGSAISIYELVYRIFMDVLESPVKEKGEKIVHVPRVLYTNDSLDEMARTDCSERIRELYGAEDTAMDKISIVIPSKDNAKTLGKCLETLTKYTAYDNYEIIIVDNGSCPEQRARITALIDSLMNTVKKEGFSIRYLYEKMAFNFSAMCNLGAESARGKYLLFLNDDIEVMDTDEGAGWLGNMMKYARKRHVGAVGAKLYYPPKPDDNECYRIQHVGITNMGIGPAHKLGGMADKGCLYHGHNTQNYDMLAVTAACMLIRRSTFDGVGGFDTDFPVAYNDVELCFALYQKGYFNVQVNDAVLIHHESLSRGQDTAPEKKERLNSEKQKLYGRYPSLRAKDIFYSPNLVQWKKDTAYNTGYLYGYDKTAEPECLGAEDAGKIFQKIDFRENLYRQNRAAGKIYDRLTGCHLFLSNIDSIEEEDGIITIDGWCVQRNRDNRVCPKKILLISTNQEKNQGKKVYAFDVLPKLREDVAALFQESVYGYRAGHKKKEKTKNVSLSGIQLRFEKEKLESGNYRIGILVNKKQLLCIKDESGSPITVDI